MTTNKAILNSVSKLLDKVSADELKNIIDIVTNKKIQNDKFNAVFATDATAVAWFKDFCAQYNLTVTRVTRTNRHTGEVVPYGRYDIEEFSQDGPYFMLWINDGHQNADTEPHIEMGSSYSDLWWSSQLNDLEEKMHKICKMRNINKEAA